MFHLSITVHIASHGDGLNHCMCVFVVEQRKDRVLVACVHLSKYDEVRNRWINVWLAVVVLFGLFGIRFNSGDA